MRTNFVDQYQTNWSTLNLTNWETVVLFKTNWISQPVTNVVQVDLPTRPAAARRRPSEAGRAARSPGGNRVARARGLGRPAGHRGSPDLPAPANDLVEVQLKVRRTDNTPGPMQVQNWRVEREDGRSPPLRTGPVVQAATAGRKIQGGSQTEGRRGRPSAFGARHAFCVAPRCDHPAPAPGEEGLSVGRWRYPAPGRTAFSERQPMRPTR